MLRSCVVRGPPSRIAWSSSVTFRVVIGAVVVEDSVERVELLVPVALVEPQPLVRAGQRARIEPAEVPPTHHGAPDETCSLEDLQVLGGRGQRHLQRLGQLADGQLPIGQPAEHVPSRVVRERVEHRVQLPQSFNHMVNDSSVLAYCQPIGYILAATLGLVLSVYVTLADVQDRVGARCLLTGLKPFVPRLKKIWADGAYTGEKLATWCEEQGGCK